MGENKLQISLRAARVNAEMTQDEAAKKLGVNTHTLINYENGKTTPGADMVARIERLYGIPYDQLRFLPRKN